MERVEAVLLLDSRLKRGLPQWFIGKESSCQCRKHRGRWFSPWVRKIAWWRTWQPIPVVLPGESHGQRSLVRYSPWGPKESDTTEVTAHTKGKYIYQVPRSVPSVGQCITLAIANGRNSGQSKFFKKRK